MYNKEDIYNRAKQVILENKDKCFFLSSVASLMGIHYDTFSKYLPNGSDERKEIETMVLNNRTNSKCDVVGALYAQAVSGDVQAIKLFLKWTGTDEERSRLSDRPAVSDDTTKNELLASQERIARAMEEGNKRSLTFKMITPKHKSR